MAGIFDFLFGNKPENKQQSVLTGGQNNLLNQIISQLGQMQNGGFGDAMSILQQYLNPESDIYKNFEQPYLNEFNQQTVPGLAERFSGMGAMGGGLSSSGFGQALSSAGGNLQSNLAAMKTDRQRQSINDFLGQYNQQSGQALGTRAFENQYYPGTGGLFGNLLGSLGSGLGSAGGLGLANYAGNNFFGNSGRSNFYGTPGGMQGNRF